MNLKKLGVAMLAALALSAVVVSTSQAAMWNSSGIGTWASGTTKEGKGRLKSGTTGVLVSKVLGSPFKLTFGAFEVTDTTFSQLFSAAGHNTGRWIFLIIVIHEPLGCKISGTLETTALSGTAQMGNTEATKASVYTKFVPTSGEVLATIKLAECAAAGSYQLKGTLYLKSTNPTGTAAVWQEAVTSGAINASQGGALTLGKEPATLEGAFESALTSGESYSLKE